MYRENPLSGAVRITGAGNKNKWAGKKRQKKADGI
jgi:hypothetical protein